MLSLKLKPVAKYCIHIHGHLRVSQKCLKAKAKETNGAEVKAGFKVRERESSKVRCTEKADTVQ